MKNYRAQADEFLAKIFGPGDQRVGPLTVELERMLESAHADGEADATSLVEQGEEEEESVAAPRIVPEEKPVSPPTAVASAPRATSVVPPMVKKKAPPKRILSAKPHPKKKR